MGLIFGRVGLAPPLLSVTVELEKTYEPGQVEKNVSEIWLSHGYFHADISDNAKTLKPYTIVIPPPNVTAPLHLGHALNNTLQDILIRFRRMQKYNTLWLPGTDHAGIATQTVVEKILLSEQGKKRTDFQRDEFIAHVQAWKDEYEATIINQLKAMGCSCDWARTRFTMDPVCAKAVRAAFFRLFEDGLIYRGKRLVNWDPATQTVLADDEVEHETVKGHFWYMRYPLVEPLKIDGTRIEHVTVATTRPETMLGDTAVAMNPNDSRAKHLLGKMVRLPIVGRIIPIIADEHVVLPDDESEDEKAKFSTGFLKVTPAHDPDDWEIGQRNNLPIVNVMAPDGSISDKYDWTDWEDIKNPDVENLIGMDRFEAREAVVEWFRTEKLLEDVREYTHEVGHSYRSHVPIEPYLSDQWYIAVKKPIPSLVQSGTGFQPVDDQINKRNGAYLPHWTQTGAIYAVTFRLADSLPVDIAEQWHTEREKIIQNAASQGREITFHEQQELERLNRDKVELYLNAGQGECYLREPEIAKLVANALKYFDGERYDLIAWIIMPNHVHAILKPFEEIKLSDIVHSWKSYTANKANELLGRMGAFWQSEYYDHLIRDEKDFTYQINYIIENPVKVGLENWPWVGVKTSETRLGLSRVRRGTGFQPVEDTARMAVPQGWPCHENTGKMPVPQDLIEGTDIPINSLAGLALKPLLDGRLRFIPERYAKTYQAWLENLRDWPISRQLWWGHRIPVWKAELEIDSYKSTREGVAHASPDEFQSQFKDEFDRLSEDAGLGKSFAYKFNPNNFAEVYICPLSEEADRLVSEFKGFSKSKEAKKRVLGQSTPLAMPSLPSFPSATEQAQKLHFKFNIRECDEDVLDTWFSSALWPFSTMGWPDDTDDLKTFYPGDVLCTAREIITLWVSRMVMMGQYCVGDIPFSDVFIHAMIQDGEGRKMSKSLGNGIDPLVAINSHGADAMRFTLASMTTQTQDVRMPVKKMKLPDGRTINTSPKFDLGRNFCNKLWNASRFTLMNLEGIDLAGFDKERMTITDKWILSRLAKTISLVTESLDEFKYSEPLSQLYRFFWNDFCDWYLEWAKPRMQDEQQRPIAQNVLAFVLDQALRLLHPFVPFITEEIFQRLNEIAPERKLNGLAEAKKSEALVVAEWPAGLEYLKNEDVEKQIMLVQDAIRTVRDIKSNRNIPPKQLPLVSARSQQENVEILNRNSDLIKQLAGIKEFKAGIAIVRPPTAAIGIADSTEVYVHDAIDPEAERERLEKEKNEIEKAKKAVEARLANKNFTTKAKPEVVAQARDRLAGLTEQLKTIEKHLAELTA